MFCVKYESNVPVRYLSSWGGLLISVGGSQSSVNMQWDWYENNAFVLIYVLFNRPLSCFGLPPRRQDGCLGVLNNSLWTCIVSLRHFVSFQRLRRPLIVTTLVLRECIERRPLNCQSLMVYNGVRFYVHLRGFRCFACAPFNGCRTETPLVWILWGK